MSFEKDIASLDTACLQAIPQIASAAGIAPPQTIRRLNGGVANRVYCLDERYVLRLGTGPDGPQFPKSAALLRAVAPAMRAPRVVYTDFSQAQYPFNVMLVTYVPGVSLCDCWKRLATAARMAVLSQVPPQLEILHGISRSNVPGIAEAPPWREALAAALEKGLHAAAGVAPTGWIPRLRDAAGALWQAMDSAGPDVVIHHDAHWNNLIVDPATAQLVAIVDFDDATVAPAEIDAWYLAYLLVYAEHPHGPSPLCHPDEMGQAIATTHALWPAAFTPGWRERYVLRQVKTILDCLTDVPPWLSAQESRQEAKAVYGALFAGKGWPAWLTGRAIAD